MSIKLFCHRAWPPVWVFVAACLVYAGGVNGAFMWDDINLVLQNTKTHGLEQLPTLLGLGDARFGFRMIRDLSYAVDYSVGGLAPPMYHISNIVYHGITSVLVYHLIGRLTRHPSAAFWGAMLFAIHPIHVDAVAYISGRRDILSALFYVAGMLAFIRFRDTTKLIWFAFAVLLAVLGVMAKEMAATLPLAWFLYDAWAAAPGRGILAGAWAAFKRYWYLYGGGGAIAAAFIAYVVLEQGVTHGAGPNGGSWLVHIMTEVVILAYAVKVTVLPVTLLIDYQGFLPPVSGLGEPRFLLSVAVLLGLIGLASWLSRGRRNGGFAWHWLWITYLPVMQIVPHPERFAEHYLYLPSVGAAMLAGMGMAWLIRRTNGSKWALVVVGALFLVLTVRTVDRIHDYRGPIPVFEAARVVNPAGMRIVNNLALAYGESGDRATALAMLFEAVERIPGPLLTTNLARYLRDESRWVEAEHWLLDAYGRTPEDLVVLDLLGDTFAKQGKVVDSRRAYEELLAIKPGHPNGMMGLANLARDAGDMATAADLYGRVVELRPKRVGAWNGLGISRQGLGDISGAKAAFKQALSMEADDGDAWNNLGVLHMQSGNPQAALTAFSRAVEASEVPPLAYINLARVLILAGQCQQAMAVLRDAGDALQQVPAGAMAQVGASFSRVCGSAAAPLRPGQ
jgi:Flp pilus assembly protein TadD